MNQLIVICYGLEYLTGQGISSTIAPEKAINFATQQDALNYLNKLGQKFQGSFEIKTFYTWQPVQAPITVK